VCVWQCVCVCVCVSFLYCKPFQVQYFIFVAVRLHLQSFLFYYRANQDIQDFQDPKDQKANLAMQAQKDERENHRESKMELKVKRFVDAFSYLNRIHAVQKIDNVFTNRNATGETMGTDCLGVSPE